MWVYRHQSLSLTDFCWSSLFWLFSLGVQSSFLASGIECYSTPENTENILSIWSHNKRPMGHIAHLILKCNNLLFFHLKRNLNPPHPRMLCAKIGWNWLSGSVEENFLISSMYFRYFKIISLWKRAGSFIWTNLNPLHPGMLWAKFGWNWLSGSGEEDF